LSQSHRPAIVQRLKMKDRSQRKRSTRFGLVYEN
jgi:hypothetical protein